MVKMWMGPNMTFKHHIINDPSFLTFLKAGKRDIVCPEISL